MAKIGYGYVCPICGKKKVLELEISDADKVKLDTGETLLKDLIKPGTFEREVLISGMCFNCQEKTFNRPAPGHEEAWGKPIGECPICGSPTYKKDIDADKCPACGFTLSSDPDDFDEDAEEY